MAFCDVLVQTSRWQMNYYKLVATFKAGYWLKTPDGKVVGKGVYESDLIKLGFSKSDLRKLSKASILKKFQMKDKGAIRNAYALPLGGIQNVNDVEKTIQKQSEENAESNRKVTH